MFQESVAPPLEESVIELFAEKIFVGREFSRDFLRADSEYPVVARLSAEQLRDARRQVAHRVKKSYSSWPRGRKGHL